MEKNLRQLKSNCLKIVLFGPESSGKTTLSKELANHYKTHWVKEYARDYLQKKWNVEKKVCELEDLIPIAIGQIKLENKLSKISKQLLICDTDLLETKVYSETYYDGYCDPHLEKYALKNTYDLYILTNFLFSYRIACTKYLPTFCDMPNGSYLSIWFYLSPYFEAIVCISNACIKR